MDKVAQNHLLVARVLDVVRKQNETSVVLAVGHKQMMFVWNDDVPVAGEVYHVTFEPDFKVHEKLSNAPNGLRQDGDVMRWRKPDAQGRTRMEALRARHIVRRAVRDYLDGEGFLEIDIPLLVQGTTPDAEIETFTIGDRHLITSAEYQIKRMEIGGFDKIYTLTQNFRVGDISTYRNPEFTMLEWARVGRTLADIESDAEKLTLAAHQALGGNGVLEYQGNTIDLGAPWDRISVIDAIENVTGVKISAFTAEEFIPALEKAGIQIRNEVRDDTVFLFTILLDHIQQYLGFERPVFLRDWPNFLTSSAPDGGSGSFTQRSELFIAGIELSDGFPSLIDYNVQEAGFGRQQKRRAHDGKDQVLLDHKFLAALQEGFPAGAGMALGFDRLVMVLTDRADIASVIAFGWEEL